MATLNILEDLEQEKARLKVEKDKVDQLLDEFKEILL